MKSLIIYYSYEGNTKLIANEIAKTLNADIMELKPVNEMKSKGFMKYVWGGKAAVMKKKPILNPLPHNISDYDLIIMGTPVWAGTFAPPFNTLFSENEIVNKKIGLFCCHAGGKGKVFYNFKKHLSQNLIQGELDIIDPLKNNKSDLLIQAKNWAKSL